jgi:hypothetical protein
MLSYVEGETYNFTCHLNMVHHVSDMTYTAFNGRGSQAYLR